MSTTSTAVKDRYNKKTYKQWACKIRPELYNKVQEYMAENNLSRKDFLEKAIEVLEKTKKA